jgi:hypothetical protein
MTRILPGTLSLLGLLLAAPALADSTEARCDVYPAGSDHTDKMMGCRFSQRQGYVTIVRDDEVTHDLTPVGDRPGNYHDQHGYEVRREDGLSDQGLIFRFPDESVYVYWDVSALNPPNDDNPTAPFSTADYDATTLLRCRDVNETAYDSCPAGILRMDGGQASIVIQDRAGEQFTINFMSDYVNATNRKAEARLEGDTWVVTIDDTDVYEVPLAAIEGG